MAIARVSDIDLFYEIHGAGTAYPVVLVMGLATDSHGWERQVPALAAGRRVLTMDNRGAGRSAKPKGPYSTAQMADDVVGVMDEVGLARAHIVGVSLGGAISQEIALRHARRVKSLTLICTFAKHDDEMARAADEGVQKAVKQPAFDVEAAMAAMASGGVQIDPKMIFGFLMPLVFSPAFLEREKELLRTMFQRTLSYGFAPEGLAGQVAAAMAHDTTKRLATIGAPTMVVTGTRDKLVSPRLSRALAAAIPGAKLVEIEGAPHGIPLERAEELNGILVPWLEAHD